jgi:hypothetical protein
MSAGKAFILVLIVVLGAAVLRWVRAGESFPFVHALPWIGGYAPGIYDVAAVAMLLIGFLGIRNLYRKDDEGD